MNTSRIFTAIAFLFVVGFSFGQKDTEVKQWKQLDSKDGIVIKFRKDECNDPKMASYTEEVYLKFANTTDQTVFVTWTYDATFGERCFNCDGNNEEMTQVLKVPANASIEGQCSDDNDLRLRIFSKFTNMENPEPLNDFHVKILSIEPLVEE